MPNSYAHKCEEMSSHHENQQNCIGNVRNSVCIRLLEQISEWVERKYSSIESKSRILKIKIMNY